MVERRSPQLARGPALQCSASGLGGSAVAPGGDVGPGRGVADCEVDEIHHLRLPRRGALLGQKPGRVECLPGVEEELGIRGDRLCIGHLVGKTAVAAQAPLAQPRKIHARRLLLQRGPPPGGAERAVQALWLN